MQFFGRRPERFEVGGLEPKAVRTFRLDYAEEVRKLNEYKQFFAVHDGVLKVAELEADLMGLAHTYIQGAGQASIEAEIQSRLTRDEARSREKYAWTLYDRTTVHETLREFTTEFIFVEFLVMLFEDHHKFRTESGKQMYSHARKAPF